MRRKIIFITFLVVVSLLIGTISSGNFFAGDINMIDEGQFASWVTNMLHGKLLFRDIYITYGPLYIYPLYFLFKIFGPSAFLVRFYLTIGGTLGIIASYFLMKILNLRRAVIAVLLIIFLLVPILNLREAAGLWAIYFLFLSHIQKSRNKSLIAGIISSLTFLISPDFGIFVYVLMIIHFLIQYNFRKNIKINIRLNLSLLVGVALPWVLFVAIAAQGRWLGSYMYVTADIITSISGINVPNGVNFPNPLVALNAGLIPFIKFLGSKEMLLYWSILIYLGSFFYLTVNFFLKKAKKEIYLLFLTSVIGIFVYSILLTRHGIDHYFYTLPLNLIVAGYFLGVALSSKRKKWVEYAIIGFILLFFLRILYANNPNIRTNLNPLTYLRSRAQNSDKVGFLRISNAQKEKIDFFQSFVLQNTTNRDYIFLFNDEPEIYMLVNRANPTNFDLPFIGNTLEKRIQMVKELKKNKPKFVFIDTDVWAVDGIPNTMRLPEVYGYILKNYKFIFEKENVRVYALN